MFLCDDVFALAQANDRLTHMQLGVYLSFAMWYTSVAFDDGDLHAQWREWFPDLAPPSGATVQDKVLWSGPVAEAVTAVPAAMSQVSVSLEVSVEVSASASASAG